MSNRIFGNQKYVDQLVAYHAIVDAINNTHTNFSNLSPQDKVAEYINQNPPICCTQVFLLWNTWGSNYDAADINWELT